MAIGSGLGTQLGFAAESVYGAYVAPTKFVRTQSHSVTPVRTRVQGEGIQSGALGPLGAHYVETTQAAAVSFSAPVETRGLGLILQAITGGTSTTVLNVATSHTQTHTLGDNYGKSLTVQVSRPTRAGVAVPATVTGVKITEATFACAVADTLRLSVQGDGRQYDNQANALATASYVATAPFHGGQMAVKMGTFNAETPVNGVKEIEVSFRRGMDTEAFYANASGLKSEPVMNALAEITGTLTADWLDKATFEDQGLTTASTSLVVEWVGAQLESGHNAKLAIHLPGVTFEPLAQGVDGLDRLSTGWSFTWRYDGTNLPKITYVTADTAL